MVSLGSKLYGSRLQFKRKYLRDTYECGAMLLNEGESDRHEAVIDGLWIIQNVGRYVLMASEVTGLDS